MALGAMEDSFEPLKVEFLVIGSWTSSNPNYLPEAPCPDNITLGIRASAYEFQGDINTLHIPHPHFCGIIYTFDICIYIFYLNHMWFCFTCLNDIQIYIYMLSCCASSIICSFMFNDCFLTHVYIQFRFIHFHCHIVYDYINIHTITLLTTTRSFFPVTNCHEHCACFVMSKFEFLSKQNCWIDYRLSVFMLNGYWHCFPKWLCQFILLQQYMRISVSPYPL